MRQLALILSFIRRKHNTTKLRKAMVALSKDGESCLFVSRHIIDELGSVYLFFPNCTEDGIDEEPFLQLRQLLLRFQDALEEKEDMKLSFKLTRGKGKR